MANKVMFDGGKYVEPGKTFAPLPSAAVFQRRNVKPVFVAVLVSAIVTVAPGTD
jgi:hypothetical protein